METETVTLADGDALQGILQGVPPIPVHVRAIAAERQRRDARRHHGALPCGGLFDETAKSQGSLF